MPRRTMTVTELWAHPKGNRRERLNLATPSTRRICGIGPESSSLATSGDCPMARHSAENVIATENAARESGHN